MTVELNLIINPSMQHKATLLINMTKIT